MRNLNKIGSLLRSKINPKFLIPTIILITIYISFYENINMLYAKYIIGGILCHFTVSIFTEVLLYISITLCLAGIFIRAKRNYQITLNFGIVSISFLIIYLIARLQGNYIFYNSLLIKELKYSDIVLVFPLYTTTLLIVNIIFSLLGNAEDEPGFRTDDPIKESNKDLYNREKYAIKLAEWIEKTNAENAFAIGVTGFWGTGKTSFFNLVKMHLNGKKNIVINFNPWNSLTKESIFSQFFETMEEQIKKYSPRLSKEIISYSNSLTNITEGYISKLMKEFVNYYTSISTVKSYDEVNSIIKEINRKLIIFIDDIDRLQKEEIIQVVKLIRNTAAFSNTIFIVAYDKNYLISALKELNSESSSFYLEKIFQIEIDLPHIDPHIIRKQLVNQLKGIFKEKYSKEIDALLSYNTSKNIPYLDLFLETMRDVSRFVNLFTFQFLQIEEEVVFEDYFNLTLIKLKYPSVVHMLYNGEKKYFASESNSNRLQYSLKFKEDKKTPVLHDDLKKLADSKIIPPDKVELIENSIKLIWGYSVKTTEDSSPERQFHMTFYADRDSKSIVYPNSFYRYFSNLIFIYDISEKQWLEYLELDLDELVKKLKEHIDNGARKEIYLRLSNISDYKERAFFEKIMRVIFALSQYKASFESTVYEAHYDYYGLYLRLRASGNYIDRFYENSDSYNTFLKGLLTSEGAPFAFSTGFIEFIAEDLNFWDKFPLNSDELMDINANYLYKYLEQYDILDETAWDLFHSCKKIEFPKPGEYRHIYSPKAKSIMRDFFSKKGVDYFIEYIVKREANDRAEIRGGTWLIFDDITDLEKFLNSMPETLKLKEFKDFLSDLKKENLQGTIKFNFKEMFKD